MGELRNAKCRAAPGLALIHTALLHVAWHVLDMPYGDLGAPSYYCPASNAHCGAQKPHPPYG